MPMGLWLFVCVDVFCVLFVITCSICDGVFCVDVFCL